MSEFANYCLFVRQQRNIKKADWKDDLLGFAQTNPELAGGLAGGGLGALTGIGSGNMIRNGLIGAGLGAGGGHLYRRLGGKADPIGDLEGVTQTVKGNDLPGGVTGPPTSVNQTTKDLGLKPTPGTSLGTGALDPSTWPKTDPSTPPSGKWDAPPNWSGTTPKATPKGVADTADATGRLPDGKAPPANPDDITTLTTRGTPMEHLLKDTKTNPEEGAFVPPGPLKEFTTKEKGQARAAKRYELGSQAAQAAQGLGLDPDKNPADKALLDEIASMQPSQGKGIDPAEAARAERLLAGVDSVKENLGKPIKAVGDVAKVPGEMSSAISGAWDARQRLKEMQARLATLQGAERAAQIDEIRKLLEEAKQY